MASKLFTREVLIDVSVNLIPIAILAAFFVLFVAVAPWGLGFTLTTAIQLALIVAPLVGVAVITYLAVTKIGGERRETE